jgi:hypothetical protein
VGLDRPVGQPQPAGDAHVGLTALGFAVAGWRLLHMRNDAFDLPPLPATR